MENIGKKNKKIYLITIVVIIIAYLIIYLFGMAIKLSILDEKNRYQNDQKKQPINHIIAIHRDNNNNNNNQNNNNHNNNSNNNSNNNHNQNNENSNENNQNPNSDVVFLYDYDENNYIDITNQFPTKDEDGMNFVGDKYTHDFKIIVSKVALGYRYKITLKKEIDSDLEDKWVKVYLTSGNTRINNCFRNNGKVKTFNEYPKYLSNIYEKVLYENVVTYQDIQKGYKEFTLRMWVSEDLKVVNEEYLQKTFKARLIVYAEEL